MPKLEVILLFLLGQLLLFLCTVDCNTRIVQCHNLVFAMPCCCMINANCHKPITNTGVKTQAVARKLKPRSFVFS